MQHMESSSQKGGRWYNLLEQFSTFCGYTSWVCKVTQFDTSSITIGPVVIAVGKVRSVQEYSLTCQLVIGWNTLCDLLIGYWGLCM